MSKSYQYQNAIVVDDEETSRVILSSILKTLGFEVTNFASADEFLGSVETTSPTLVFLDYRLGDDDGLEVLDRLVKRHPTAKTLMITAHGTVELALKAMRRGAIGFITKPFEEDDVAVEIQRATKQQERPLRVPLAQDQRDSGIMGVSPAIKRIHDQINKMKDVNTTVLINGESGTGKELIASALHNLSKCKDERFEAINCAAIPETLLEAELFGYRKGAFTDAKQDRKGLFEVCSKGTLFLDEVGELPLALQSKLLRVLQEKVVTPLGSSQSVKVGTRVVAATNRNLKWLVNERKFRKDLYYRLSILQIESPPLRERSEDIPELVVYFARKIAAEHGKPPCEIDDDIMVRLESYDWPGNVRELQNSLERAIVLSENGKISLDDIFAGSHFDDETAGGSNSSESVSIAIPLTEAKDDFERKYLDKLLRMTKGNVSQASRVAGRIRTDMYRLFSKYDLNPNDYK